MTFHAHTAMALRLVTGDLARTAIALGALALSACASGGSFETTGHAHDALHADLDVCAATDGDRCDPSATAACADAADFSVVCECVVDDTTREARVHCAPPLPVPAILVCSADIAPGVACRADSALTDAACVLPEGGRCVCREVTDDPAVPARARFAWSCEVPGPVPSTCMGAVTGELCGSADTTCEGVDGTRCYCAGSPDGDAAPRWICEGPPPPAVPFCRDVIRGFPDAVVCSSDTATCLLDDGRAACRCIPNEDGTSRLECEGPPPPPRMFCPRDLDPSSTARLECDPIGAACELSSGLGRCSCVEDDLRDPARPVGYWSCDTAVIDPPPPPSRDDSAA